MSAPRLLYKALGEGRTPAEGTSGSAGGASRHPRGPADAAPGDGMAPAAMRRAGHGRRGPGCLYQRTLDSTVWAPRRLGRCCSEPPSRRYSQYSAPPLSCLCMPTPVSTRRQMAQAPSVLTRHQLGLPQMGQGV